MLKTWSSTPATVALSSAEAEFYALTKGAAQALGLMTLLADLGVEVQAAVHTHAAIGIVRRSGFGKLRHLNVRYLWLQDQVAAGNMALHKVQGLVNPGDLVTKRLAQAAVTKQFSSLDMWVESGRAATAPTLNLLLQEDGEPRCPWDLSGGKLDVWRLNGEEAVRVHHKPRCKLFTPLRVAGAPPSRSLTPARVTEGRFVDTGEAIRRVDSWTTKSTAYTDLGRRWTGTTRFLMRIGHGETTEKEARAPAEQALAETFTEHRGEDGEARCRACIRQAWTAQDRGSQLRVKHDAATLTPAHRGQRVSLSKELVVKKEYEVEGAKEAHSIASRRDAFRGPSAERSSSC